MVGLAYERFSGRLAAGLGVRGAGPGPRAASRRGRRRVERLLQLAVQWAVTHPAESVEEAETIVLRCSGDTGIPVAGPGAPLIAEFSVAEFAAAVGLGTETGKRYVGQAVELRYRLPKLWARVASGDLAAWKARRIADDTMHLSVEAAEYVDQHLAPVAHKVRPAQVDRLVVEAVTRFMPEQAEQDRRRAWDQRHATVDYSLGRDRRHLPGPGGGRLVADAIGLDHAAGPRGAQGRRLGPTRPDRVRAARRQHRGRRDQPFDVPAATAREADPKRVPPGHKDVEHPGALSAGRQPDGRAARGRRIRVGTPAPRAARDGPAGCAAATPKGLAAAAAGDRRPRPRRGRTRSAATGSPSTSPCAT